MTVDHRAVQSVGPISGEIDRLRDVVLDPESTNCPACPSQLSDHRRLLHHILVFHPKEARDCVQFACYQCNVPFASQRTLSTHLASCPSARKRRREDNADDLSVDHAAKRAKLVTCCGYSFSGRKWNYARHLSTRHDQGNAQYLGLLMIGD